VGARLVVLVSGAGTNLQALLRACADSTYGADVVAVGSDRADSPALGIASAAGVATFVTPVADYADREAWNDALAAEIARHDPDLVVCAGFMRVLGPQLIDAYAGRIVNTHPALLPSFPGTHAVRDALAYGVKVTGVTVHFVDRGVDTGPVIAQTAVVVRSDDDEATLHARIKAVERPLLVSAVGRLARGGYRLDGRKVVLP
jgi:phosphoribosylglycinamide formyltransferase-1